MNGHLFGDDYAIIRVAIIIIVIGAAVGLWYNYWWYIIVIGIIARDH